LNLLDGECEKINKFLTKSFDDLIYKNQIIMFGRTKAGKSTLDTKLLVNDDKIKVFPSAGIAETFAPCKISVDKKLEKANIQINYNTEEIDNHKADTLESLVDILHSTISKKAQKNNDSKFISNCEIDSPQNFFPKVKSGFIIIDTPGFSENEKMKKFNLSQLSKEKNRSVIIFIIPLETGGSLMQENVDILSAYKSD